MLKSWKDKEKRQPHGAIELCKSNGTICRIPRPLTFILSPRWGERIKVRGALGQRLQRILGSV